MKERHPVVHNSYPSSMLNEDAAAPSNCVKKSVSTLDDLTGFHWDNTKLRSDADQKTKLCCPGCPKQQQQHRTKPSSSGSGCSRKHFDHWLAVNIFITSWFPLQRQHTVHSFMVLNYSNTLCKNSSSLGGYFPLTLLMFILVFFRFFND